MLVRIAASPPLVVVAVLAAPGVVGTDCLDVPPDSDQIHTSRQAGGTASV